MIEKLTLEVGSPNKPRDPSSPAPCNSTLKFNIIGSEMTIKRFEEVISEEIKRQMHK